MAPDVPNEFLANDEVWQHFISFDPQLIKVKIEFHPGEDMVEVRIFDRRREAERLNTYLAKFEEVDFRDGQVTLTDAVHSIYGRDDDYLTIRLAGNYLKSESPYNKAKAEANGHVTIVGEDGMHIRRMNRLDAARNVAQVGLDRFERIMTAKMDASSKRPRAAVARAKKIAPGYEDEIDAIAAQTLKKVVTHQTKALSQGE